MDNPVKADRNYDRITLLLILFSLFLFYRNEIIWIFRTWYYKEYESFGYIALLGFILYIWKNKFQIKKGSLYILFLFTFLWAISIFIKSMNINILSSLLFICIIMTVIYYYFNENIKENPSSLLLLFLTLPWIYHINLFFGFTLRKISTELSGIFLTLWGVKVTVQGTMLFLETLRLEVGAPCSGSKYLFFTAFFLIIMGLLTKEKIVFLFPVSAIIAISSNVMRITSIAYLRMYLHGEESIAVHNAIGLFYFIISLLGVYIICRKARLLKLPLP